MSYVRTSLFALFVWSIALTCGGAEMRGAAEFDRTVAPLLRKYCGDCHAKNVNDGRWSFEAYPGYVDLLADHKTWSKAELYLRNRLMPPPGASIPTEAERKRLLDWIDESVFYVDPLRPDPGRTTLRRLNRTEYDNSVRDVLGIDGHPAEQFPPDDSGYGFDNIGDVLSLSPLHLEKYLAAAREAAAEATRLSPPYRLGVDLPPERLTIFAGTPQLEDKVMLLRSPSDEVGAIVDVQLPSVYRILARLAVAGGETEQDRPRVDVLLSGKKIADLAPTTSWTGKAGFFPGSSSYVELPAGKHRLSLRMTAANDKTATNSGAKERIVAIGFYELSGPFTPLPPRPSAYLRSKFDSRPLAPPILYLSGEDMNAGSGRSGADTGRVWFASNGFRRAPLNLPQGGKFRVRLKVGAQQVGPDRTRFEIRAAGRTIGPFTVTVGSQAEQWIETECDLPAGEHDWQVWFLNEFKDPRSGEERRLWLHEYSVEGPLDAPVGPTQAELVEALTRTGRRLYRRPLTVDEIAKLKRLIAAAAAAGQPPLGMLRTGIEALLISPKFLFHPSPAPSGIAVNGAVPIDELTLATRLSYFLWSSVPDEELLSLAERGELRRHFGRQVARMLRDPRSVALTANFAGQWLQLRDLDHVTPDMVKFPSFDARLAADFRRESELLFEHILRENRPLLEFLDADYTFANARLAAHYGLPAQAGEEFQRVSLAATSRRGVLTHAGVLTITSHPTRTSPVKRGKWLLEQILGTTPPPAPRDVPPLPESREDESLTMRKRLERHRADTSCASCHALLDPMGFALENYDAIGRWRIRDGEHPIDAGGRLLTGEPFIDWSELQRLLVRDRHTDFVRCLTENLLTYALGRGVTYHDKLTIRAIAARADTPDFGFQDLILAICESVPFQRMRSE